MNMIILMIVIYVVMDNIVYKHTILLVVSIVLQVNTSGSSASDHASESNCKICGRSRYSYQDMDLATGVLRENT